MGPPKMDRSKWRVLTKRGPLEKRLANYFSIFALRLKDCLEIVLVNGFSLVGPLFAAQFPYPLPAVSLAVY